jgi:hypothetical protein
VCAPISINAGRQRARLRARQRSRHVGPVAAAPSRDLLEGASPLGAGEWAQPGPDLAVEAQARTGGVVVAATAPVGRAVVGAVVRRRVEGEAAPLRASSQRQLRRQRWAAQQQAGQPIPPERRIAADNAGGAEHRGRHVEGFEHRQRRREVVAVAVVEGHNHRGARAATVPELVRQLGQRHRPPPPSQRLHLRREVRRRHAQLPLIERGLGDAVVHQDQRRRRQRVG